MCFKKLRLNISSFPPDKKTGYQLIKITAHKSLLIIWWHVITKDHNPYNFFDEKINMNDESFESFSILKNKYLPHKHFSWRLNVIMIISNCVNKSIWNGCLWAKVMKHILSCVNRKIIDRRGWQLYSSRCHINER